MSDFPMSSNVSPYYSKPYQGGFNVPSTILQESSRAESATPRNSIRKIDILNRL
jgi:hypothetical protein